MSGERPVEEIEGLRRRVLSLEAELSGLRLQHAEAERRNVAQASELGHEAVLREWRIFDIALSHAPDSTYLFDLTGRVLFANQALLHLWGTTLDAVEGKRLLELGYAPELALRIERQIQEIARTGTSLRDVADVERADGIHRAEYIFVPVFNSRGDVEAVAGSTRDITDHYRALRAVETANQELERTRTQLVNIFESITDAFCALDRDWRFAYINRQAEKILFRKREDLLGKNVWEEFPPAAGSNFQKEFERAIAEQVAVEFEEYYPPLEAWLEVRAYPSQDGLGIYFHDITARKRVSEQMQQQTDELARINSELEHFAYAAAHDLQEPLRMIIIFTQKLQREYSEAMDDEGREYMQFAVQGGLRMEMLVRDLLAYTQAASGAELAPRWADANKTWSETIADLQLPIEKAGAAVGSEPLPAVAVPSVHLRQVFQNLLTNALKYRRPGVPISVQITAQQNGSFVRFAVSDNGIGIEGQYARQIFGIFKRLHNKDEYEGTGIGLAIVQKIVKRYGGQIWVESRVGEGSTFFFTLPSGADVK